MTDLAGLLTIRCWDIQRESGYLDTRRRDRRLHKQTTSLSRPIQLRSRAHFGTRNSFPPLFDSVKPRRCVLLISNRSCRPTVDAGILHDRDESGEIDSTLQCDLQRELLLRDRRAAWLAATVPPTPSFALPSSGGRSGRTVSQLDSSF